jgi:hypothetical protein
VLGDPAEIDQFTMPTVVGASGDSSLARWAST